MISLLIEKYENKLQNNSNYSFNVIDNLEIISSLLQDAIKARLQGNNTMFATDDGMIVDFNVGNINKEIPNDPQINTQIIIKPLNNYEPKYNDIFLLELTDQNDIHDSDLNLNNLITKYVQNCCIDDKSSLKNYSKINDFNDFVKYVNNNVIKYQYYFLKFIDYIKIKNNYQLELQINIKIYKKYLLYINQGYYIFQYSYKNKRFEIYNNYNIVKWQLFNDDMILEKIYRQQNQINIPESIENFKIGNRKVIFTSKILEGYQYSIDYSNNRIFQICEKIPDVNYEDKYYIRIKNKDYYLKKLFFNFHFRCHKNNNKHYISVDKMYKYITINEKQKPCLAEYNFELQRWQDIKEWEIYPNDIMQKKSIGEQQIVYKKAIKMYKELLEEEQEYQEEIRKLLKHPSLLEAQKQQESLEIEEKLQILEQLELSEKSLQIAKLIQELDAKNQASKKLIEELKEQKLLHKQPNLQESINQATIQQQLRKVKRARGSKEEDKIQKMSLQLDPRFFLEAQEEKQVILTEFVDPQSQFIKEQQTPFMQQQQEIYQQIQQEQKKKQSREEKQETPKELTLKESGGRETSNTN